MVVRGQLAGQDNGVADERSSAATAPCGIRVHLTNQRRDTGGVRRGHRRAADPDIATTAAHDGAVDRVEELPGPGGIGARPAGEDAPASEYVAGVCAASPPGAVTSTGEPTFE